MKRFALLVLIISSAVSVHTQTLSFKNSFDNGIILARGGHFETALTEFRTSLSLLEEKATRDGRGQIHFNMGVCLYHLKKYDGAINELNLAVGYRPKYESAFYSLGMAEAELRNWNKAEAAFLQALNINNRYAEAWYDLGYIYLATNRFDDAQAAFQKAARYHSIDSAMAHNNIGVIFALRNDFSSAEKEFETSLKESGGKLIEAKDNLEYCRRLAQNHTSELTARLEFKYGTTRINADF
jgi:Flp pilus assembly protein TadD